MRKELSLKTFLYYIVIVGVCAVLETLWHTLPGIAIATMAGFYWADGITRQTNNIW